jgi:hypothetical protein
MNAGNARGTRHALAALVLLPFACLSASADVVLLGNLAETRINAFIGFNNVFIEAASFTTGSVSAVVSEVDAAIGANEGTVLFAQLRADRQGLPGSLIHDLGTFRFFTTGEQLARFSGRDTARVEPLTPYWLVIGTTAGGANWSLTASHDALSTAGWVVGRRTQSNDAGVTWLPPRRDVDQVFSITGSLVPEPSSLVLACLGMAGMALCRMRCFAAEHRE